MTAPEPPCLPAEMAGAYVTFLKSLSTHQGMSVSPARYLRLCLDAATAPLVRIQADCRARVQLQIGTRAVTCIYDARGGVLVKALAETDPGWNRGKQPPAGGRGKVCDNGTRRKQKLPRKFKRGVEG